MVIYDDKQGLSVPYALDNDCKGALQGDYPPVVFPDRKAARKAIAISVAFNKLRKLQGEPYNSDFIDSFKHIKVINVEVVE